MRLQDYDFANLYMLLDHPTSARWNLVHPVEGIPGAETTLPCHAFAPETAQDLHILAAEIRKRIENEPGRREFCLTFPTEIGTQDLGTKPIRLRVVWQPPALSSISVNCRRLEPEPPSIEMLRLPKPILDWLLAPGGAVIMPDRKSYRPGGVIICGNTSAGKTTTMTAIIMACLRRQGGFCYNMGTAPEYEVEGAVGDAGCMFQIPVDAHLSKSEWETASEASLKWHPAIVAIGEIGTPASARAFISMCNSNRLVMSTLHAESPSVAVERLARLATQDVASVSDMIKLIAQHLSLIVFQELSEDGARVQILNIAAWREHNAKDVADVFSNNGTEKVINRVRQDTEDVLSGRWAASTQRPTTPPPSGQTGGSMPPGAPQTRPPGAPPSSLPPGYGAQPQRPPGAPSNPINRQPGR